ncbi:Fur family transcriptional regulator [uncultured Jatrophihabitans sp.]|uniref:Fur family transcriptional regulator n=1 Tax=uncultured Jatrophihabitans sp. TaxID=1610747 RepID=UPI0035CA8279
MSSGRAPRATTARAPRPEPAPATTQSGGRQRSTKQARAIETALGAADGFRTAHELFTEFRAAGERIGLTTVYRHLTLLADTDRADVVHTADGEAQYRLCGPRDSENPDEHHHHVVCRVCGRSVEVSGPEVEAWAERVATAAGYTDITHTVELFGLCPQHSPATTRSRKRKPRP